MASALRAECELVQVLFGTYSSLVSLQRLYKDNGYICTVLNRLQAAVTCSNSGILKSQSTSGASGFPSFGTDPLASHGLGPKSHLWRTVLRETSQHSQATAVNCCKEPTSKQAVGEEADGRKGVRSSVWGNEQD